MHREVTHNKFHASFGHFVEAIFDFFRRRMPQERTPPGEGRLVWRPMIFESLII